MRNELTVNRGGQMNLVFVTKTLDSRGGGAERVITQVTAELARRGHQITLVTFGTSAEPDFYPVDPAVRRIWLASGDVQKRTRLSDLLMRVTRLRRVIRDIAPDAAVGFMHSAYVPLALALMRSSVPVIASEHTVYNYFADRPVDAAILRATASLYATFTTISAATKSTFPRVLAKRMVIIANPVVNFNKLADPIGGPTKILLSVGRLDGPKDHPTLIRAFGQIAADHPNWILRIVGEGPLRHELGNLTEKLDLAGRVQFAGLVANIENEFRSAQLFAMPSQYESFGLAAAEALGAGLPVIGFASCPGTNQLIQNGVNGLLVSDHPRARALSQGLAMLMGNPKARQKLGKNGPVSVKQYSLERVADSWEALIRSISDNCEDPSISI